MCTHAVYNNVYLVTVGRVIVDAVIGLASMCTHAVYNNVYLVTVGRVIVDAGIGLASMCTVHMLCTILFICLQLAE